MSKRYKDNPLYEKRKSSNGHLRWFRKQSLSKNQKEDLKDPHSDFDVRMQDSEENDINMLYQEKLGSSYARERESLIHKKYPKHDEEFEKIYHDFSRELPDEYLNDLKEYYATPIGYMQLKGYNEISYRKHDVDEDGDILFRFPPYNTRGMKLSQWIDIVDSYRKERIVELEEFEDKNEQKPEYQFEKQFLSQDEIRKTRMRSDTYGDPDYFKLSDYAVSHLNDEELSCLHWYAGHGSVLINGYLAGAYTMDEVINGDNDVDMTKERFEKSITMLSNMINNSPLDEPVILYRGVSQEQLYDLYEAELYSGNVSEYVKVGDEFTFSGFSSSSTDPSTAAKFADRRIVFEMKTQSAFPNGSARSARESELEFIINKDTTFKVIDVQENVKYEKKRYEGIVVSKRPCTVIQLEEVV